MTSLHRRKALTVSGIRGDPLIFTSSRTIYQQIAEKATHE